MTSHPDGIALLMDDHRTVERLYEEFQTSGGDVERRNALKNRIVHELSVHAVVEEEHLYPATQEAFPGGDELAHHSVEEHQEIKEVLDDIDATAPDDPALDGKLATLMADVNHHVTEEEGELFPKLRSALGEDGVRDLGAKLQAARRTAPTRPHPNAPNTPPWNKAAGAPAAALDRLRDTVRSLARDE